MSPSEWERLLTAHYLREDGPFGGAPLDYLDATPAELALAAGMREASDAEVQEAFLSQFDIWSTTAWLDGRRVLPPRDREVPGYFRYLVLTGLVSATEQGAGSTRDFRKRLGELLGHHGPVQAVTGVNRLWSELAAWSEARRAAGHPIRRVALPDPGRMKLIGLAVLLAFPSWRDRQTLTSILAGLPPSVRHSPRRLTAELMRPHHHGACSPNVASALDDFAAGLAAGRADIADHRFWRLVESVEQRLEHGRRGQAVERWRFQVVFGGVEQDEVDVSVVRREARGSAGAAIWSGSFETFLDADPRRLPADLVRLRDRGLMVLGEAPGAVWSVDDLGAPESWAVVILSRADGAAPRLDLPISWTHVGGGWVASDPINADTAATALQSVGLRPKGRERLVDLSLEHGVPTRRGSWLGRPAFLPRVRVPEGATLSLEPCDQLSVDEQGRLVAEGSLTGGWQVCARAGGVKTERRFYLESDAPERDEWPSLGDAFEPLGEIQVGANGPSFEAVELTPSAGPSTALLDLLEAVYAHGSTVWGEAEFVELLGRVLPARWTAWDVMRAFAEAGWAEVGVSRRWRARRWRLSPPTLVPIDARRALVEGALCAAARRRLGDAARSLGGTIVCGGDLEWSPDIVVALDVEPAALADAMTWPVASAASPDLAAAPRCWSPETRTTDGRELAGVWSFETGGFREDGLDGGPWRLERWIRSRGDDRDLFRLRGPGADWATTSRTAAILEAHRRAGLPLFVWSAGVLTRRVAGGHLPLPVARALRRSSLRQTGLVDLADGRRTYSYPASRGTAAWLAGCFGAAVQIPSLRTGAREWLDSTVAARREGRAPVWYSARRAVL